MALIRSDRATEKSASPAESPFGRFGTWRSGPLDAFRRLLEEDQVKVEEFVEDEQLVVRAELPGVDPERDIDVSIVDGNLRIRAERRHEEKVEKRNYRKSEIRYGSFARVLPLPASADESDIKASYVDGILEVRAPLDHERSKRSRIPISRDRDGRHRTLGAGGQPATGPAQTESTDRTS
jgi:HSP20 family protein